jgi:hypothetical protein
VKNNNDPLDDAITTMLATLKTDPDTVSEAEHEDDRDPRTPRELANDLRNGRW